MLIPRISGGKGLKNHKLLLGLSERLEMSRIGKAEPRVAWTFLPALAEFGGFLERDGAGAGRGGRLVSLEPRRFALASSESQACRRDEDASQQIMAKALDFSGGHCSLPHRPRRS